MVGVIARLFIFGWSPATTYFEELIVDFLIVGFLFFILWIPAYNIFIAPYIVGKELEDKIKELEPVKANIEIIIPSGRYSNQEEIPLVYGINDTAHLLIRNRNKTADLEKCYARFEFIGLYSIYEGEINWYKFDDINYQKNILWDKNSFEDGTITISADGKDVLNLLQMTDEGFSFLFQNNEIYKQNITKTANRPYNFLVQIRIFGHLNGHPILDFRELYTIHYEYIPTVTGISGREMTNEEVATAWVNQRLVPHLQIKKGRSK